MELDVSFNAQLHVVVFTLISVPLDFLHAGTAFLALLLELLNFIATVRALLVLQRGLVRCLKAVVLSEALLSFVDGAEGGQPLLFELNQDLFCGHLVDILGGA